MRVPFYVIYSFSLVAFTILSLYLIFVSLITICLRVFLLGFILPGTLCASQTWLTISFPMLGTFSAIISSSIFPDPSFLFLLDPYNENVGVFNVVPEVSQVVFISLHSFFCVLFCSIDFHHFVFQVTYPFFCLSYSAIDSFQCIIHLCLFFSSCRSLVNISCIFSIIILNSLSGRCLSPIHLVFLGFYLIPLT